MRFGVLVHDLVPVRHPEWCHRGVPRMFREWYADVLPFCDVVFANSRHTAADVEAWTRESGIVLNGAVQVLPIGSGFGEVRAPVAMPGLPAPGSYVLFVSTMEARKNHALLFRVWSKLLDAVAEGTRAPDSVPDLVFAGRIGWLVADLLAQLDNTKWLGGRIKFVADPVDAELRALYAGCLFTVFPSWHEGWGLPVTESLALGKPCLSSNAASLPEAGGTMCRFFDPGNVGSAYAAVAAVLDDRAGLAVWESRVRAEFVPTPWTETASAVIGALDQVR
jgi:glycosyltransferase involved in cell wall biosynthesis